MVGMRPLSDEEIRDVCKAFVGEHATRDKALFLLGIATGFRISELLSLRVGDVYQYGRVVERVTVARAHMKKKLSSRTVKLNDLAQSAVNAQVEELQRRGDVTTDTFLFKSRKGENQAITRQMADKVLRDAFEVCEVAGRLGTHCMRKTFANKVYQNLGGDLVKTQRAMGHSNINSTVKYMSFRDEEIDEAIDAIDVAL